MNLGRSNLYGNLPKHKSGSCCGQIDRKAVAKIYGFSYFEIIKAYNNWILIFRFQKSNLTFEQYLNKLVEAGITPSNVGKRSTDYSLSRINDEGPYTQKSCRFITTRANCLEQKYVDLHAAKIAKYGIRGVSELNKKAGHLGGKAFAEKCKNRRALNAKPH